MPTLRKKTDEVFGVSPSPRDDSYVDRGNLDSEILRYLKRDTHIALRGESKCGKSWLRQKTSPDAIIVQCRLSKKLIDIYIDALAMLGISFEVTSTSIGTIKGTVKATAETGSSLLIKTGISVETTIKQESSTTYDRVGHDINDLRYIAEIIKASGRRLIVEDFHYLKIEERKHFAFDLKALWDFGLYVTIIGVWSRSNMLLHLNPDLSARVHEISLEWSEHDLRLVIERGCEALNINFSEKMVQLLVKLAVGNVGILQRLTLLTLDTAHVYESDFSKLTLDDLSVIETAALNYAEELNALYQQFAKNVSRGIRTRNNSTGIYAHAMAVIMGAEDEKLINGLHVDEIFTIAHSRQSRIQRGNLKLVLEKIDELQIDEDGRGLVLSYNEGSEEVTVVDRQLLLYRKYCTVKWPWEDLIAEAGEMAMVSPD